MMRKRNPVKPATLSTWQCAVDKWLYPALGDLPLANATNATVKVLIGWMHKAALSAKSVSNYVGLVKLIVASAMDENGKQLFPRKWNHEFLDIPVVENQ
jgi:hypothetical protein